MGSIEEAASPVTFPTYDRPVYSNDFWASIVPGKTDLSVGLSPEAKNRFAVVNRIGSLPDYAHIIATDMETLRKLDDIEKQRILDFYKGTQYEADIKRAFTTPDISVKVSGKWAKPNPAIPILVVLAIMGIIFFWGKA